MFMKGETDVASNYWCLFENINAVSPEKEITVARRISPLGEEGNSDFSTNS